MYIHVRIVIVEYMYSDGVSLLIGAGFFQARVGMISRCALSKVAVFA